MAFDIFFVVFCSILFYNKSTMIEEAEKKIKVKRPRKKTAGGTIKVKRTRKPSARKSEHVIDLTGGAVTPLYEEPIVRETLEERIASSVPSFTPEAVNAPRSAWPFGVYRNIALTFIIVSLLSLAAVAYFAFVRLEVRITPTAEQVQAKTVFAVYDRPESYAVPEGNTLGLVRMMEVEREQTVPTTGKKSASAKVSGTVTIFNNYSKDQPLVTTTRLLTPDNQLLRLAETVLVPAGGSVEAEVYSDEVDPSFTLANARLTIPGLWAGLQDKIYAEATAGSVTYQEEVEHMVTQVDIDEATRLGKAALAEQAKQEIEAAYASYNQRLYQLEDASVTATTDAKVGDIAESVTVKLVGSVKVVAFNDQGISSLTNTALVAATPENREVDEATAAAPTYALKSFDGQQNVAEVEMATSAPATASTADGLVDRKKIVNLSRSQLTDYLNSLPNIESHEEIFTPSFWPWTPQLTDRITITVK